MPAMERLPSTFRPNRHRPEQLANVLPRQEIEMIHQLRIYEIFEENKAVFHARDSETTPPALCSGTAFRS